MDDYISRVAAKQALRCLLLDGAADSACRLIDSVLPADVEPVRNMKLTPENVRYTVTQLLNDLDYWGQSDKEAEKTLAYIAGAMDMANVTIKAINELNGEKKNG